MYKKEKNVMSNTSFQNEQNMFYMILYHIHRMFAILIDTKESPDTLQEVMLDLIATEECKTTEDLPSDTSVICALTPNKDTCSVSYHVFYFLNTFLP